MLHFSSDHRYKQQRQTDIWDFFLLLAQIDTSSKRFQGTPHFHTIAGFSALSHCLLVIEQRPRRRTHGTKRPWGRRGLRGWGGNGTKQKAPELLVHYNNNNGWKTADGRRTSRTGERPPSNCGDADSSNNTPGSDPLSFPSSCLFSHYFYFPSERADNMHDTNFALFFPFVCVCVLLGKHSWRGFPISFHSLPSLLSFSIVCLSCLV
jgi:hypothetical protein